MPNVPLLLKLMRLLVRPLFLVVVLELPVQDVPQVPKLLLPLPPHVMQVRVPPVDPFAKANSADIY